MPLFRLWKEDAATFGIWQVTESNLQLRRCLTASLPYDEELSHYRAACRQTEYLAVRVLLRTLLGEEKQIGHLDSGKPYLCDGSWRISISHTKGYVAVALHPAAEVGIDIEQVHERVRGVATHFVRSDELPGFSCLSPSDQLYALLLHWSAKETIFKVLGCSNVDFREHLRIFPFPLAAEGDFRAQEYRTPSRQQFQVSYLLHPHFVCTTALSAVR